ncbi:hypothetical protein KKG61_02425 [bacterium]|nr:hypothetical protein [bacterium]
MKKFLSFVGVAGVLVMVPMWVKAGTVTGYSPAETVTGTYSTIQEIWRGGP